MTSVPPVASFPRIRSSLKYFQISAVTTGVLLIGLCLEMILKYGFGMEVDLGGKNGLLVFVPNGTTTGYNLSTGFLVIHGWFYVVYLFCDFQLWSAMRWPFVQFLVIALGGIIPGFSFWLERKLGCSVSGYLASREVEAVAGGKKA